MGDQDREQRLLQRPEPRAQGPDVGDQQAGIDYDHARLGLDQVRVDVQPGLGCPVGVDDRSGHGRSLLVVTL
jgi:hypothetical protein